MDTALIVAAFVGSLFFMAMIVFAIIGMMRRPKPPPGYQVGRDEAEMPARPQPAGSAEPKQYSFGFGPLRGLMEDKTVTEIMVNGPSRIFVERDGRIELTNIRFSDDKHVVETIRRVIAGARRRIDDKSPMVDARLEDGSRVNAVLHPVATIGPCLTIRKFSHELYSLDDLREMGSISDEMSEYFYAAITERKNILVSGGSGSGKTTLLNVLASLVPVGERVVTIEDAAELRLPQANIVALESRPPNVEGEGAITIRHLVVNALRMRPDRIVVGECRGPEALDMLQAMNTGHDGCLTTLHANSPRDALARLETLTLMAGMDLPSSAVRQQIVSAVDIIVQTSRLADGTRKVVHIAEVTGLEAGNIVMRDLFKYRHDGADVKGDIQGAFLPVNPGPAMLQATPAAAPPRRRGVQTPAATRRR